MEKDRPTTSPPLSREQVAALQEVAAIAAMQAGNALSSLSRIPVQISAPEVSVLRLSEIPTLFGGLDAPAIGVLVPFQGDMEGNGLLLFPEKGIRELEGALLGLPIPAGDDLRRSAFAEIGNILTGKLLTVLSTLSEKIVVNLPPLVIQDMAGAILDAILAEVGARTDEVTVLVFKLSDPDGANLVRSVLIPGSAGIELFLEAAGRLKKDS
jgi:chemotaxis protein CheC